MQNVHNNLIQHIMNAQNLINPKIDVVTLQRRLHFVQNKYIYRENKSPRISNMVQYQHEKDVREKKSCFTVSLVFLVHKSVFLAHGTLRHRDQSAASTVLK